METGHQEKSRSAERFCFGQSEFEVVYAQGGEINKDHKNGEILERRERTARLADRKASLTGACVPYSAAAGLRYDRRNFPLCARLPHRKYGRDPPRIQKDLGRKGTHRKTARDMREPSDVRRFGVDHLGAWV